MKITNTTIEISQYGRPILWLAESSWYGGKTHNRCLFINRDAAIKWASFEAEGFVDWANFPDPARKYPYDDRNATEQPVLTPVWRVYWEKEAGGYAQVTRCEASVDFDWVAEGAPKPPISVWE